MITAIATFVTYLCLESFIENNIKSDLKKMFAFFGVAAFFLILVLK